MVHEDDEALRRMRAADPAHGSYPDQASLRRRLLGRTPAPLAGSGADPYGQPFPQAPDAYADTAVRVHDGTTRGSRTTLVAAAAVAALAIGAGGYAVGLQSADQPGTGGSTVASTGADDESDAGSDAESGGDDAAGTEGAVGEDWATDSEGFEESILSDGAEGSWGYDSTSSYYPFGPTVLVADPRLSTEGGGTGEVRMMRAAEVDGVAFLEDWATRLGLDGEVDDQSGDGYYVLEAEGIVLTVSTGSTTDFNYQNDLADPFCAEMAAEDDVSFFSGGSPISAQDCLPVGERPGKDEAIAQAQEFLVATGVPTDDLTWSTETYEGDPYVSVVGTRDGGPNSYFFAGVTGAGVAHAYGVLGDYVSLGDYPVISPTEAVERASDPRFAADGVWIPGVDDTDLLLTEEHDPWEEWTDLDLAEGDLLPYPVHTATIVEASLETGVMYLPDGSEILVPAYDLVDEDGGHYAVLALAEEALDLTP